MAQGYLAVNVSVADMRCFTRSGRVVLSDNWMLTEHSLSNKQDQATRNTVLPRPVATSNTYRIRGYFNWP